MLLLVMLRRTELPRGRRHPGRADRHRRLARARAPWAPLEGERTALRRVNENAYGRRDARADQEETETTMTDRELPVTEDELQCLRQRQRAAGGDAAATSSWLDTLVRRCRAGACCMPDTIRLSMRPCRSGSNIERLVRQPRVGVWRDGGHAGGAASAGWRAAAAPSVFQTLTVDAMEAHRRKSGIPSRCRAANAQSSAAMADQALRLGPRPARLKLVGGRLCRGPGVRRPS